MREVCARLRPAVERRHCTMTSEVSLLRLSLAGLIGLAAGSFCATFAIRASKGEQAFFGRSHCDGCQRTLTAFETLPVIGYVTSRATCRTCHQEISALHLAGEVSGAVICMLATLLVSPWRATLVAGLGLVLMTSAVIDLLTQKLPNRATLAIAVLGGTLALNASFARAAVGLLAALLWGLGLTLLSSIARPRPAACVAQGAVRDGQSLGFGDVKLVAALALWLGPNSAIMVALAAFLGLITLVLSGRMSARLPFGPFLAASAFLIGMVQETGGSLPLIQGVGTAL